MVVASVFSGTGLVAIAAVAVASFVVAQRAWRWSVVLVVAADALTWSWASWLKSFGNVVYWGSAAAVGVALVLLARSSRLARVLLLITIVVGAALLATAAWSFEPHATAREAITFGSALAVAAFAVARSYAESRGPERLVDSLAVLAPGAIVVSALLVVFDHGAAVAEGGGVSGFVNGPNSLGLLVSLAIGFLLAFPPVARSSGLLAVALGVVAFALTLSASRTGMLAALLAFVAYELGMRHWRRLGVGLVVAACAGVLAAVWAPDVPTFGRPLSPITAHPTTPAQVKQIVGGRVAGQSEFSALVGARDEAWREATRLLGRRPVLGTGFGTGSEIFAHDNVRNRFRYFVGAFDANANVHDAYLQELLELGVVGGLLFIVPAIASLVLVLLAIRRGWRSRAEAAFGATAVAAFVCAVFESVLAGFGAMTLLAWLSFGMLIVPEVTSRLAHARERQPGELESPAVARA